MHRRLDSCFSACKNMSLNVLQFVPNHFSQLRPTLDHLNHRSQIPSRIAFKSDTESFCWRGSEIHGGCSWVSVGHWRSFGAHWRIRRSLSRRFGYFCLCSSTHRQRFGLSAKPNSPQNKIENDDDNSCRLIHHLLYFCIKATRGLMPYQSSYEFQQYV